ncbi:MAG: WHG domain-containing protein [Acidobacteriota bacterium]|nr:WHG domain-containing protein [Acidobacteriota bacterium]
MSVSSKRPYHHGNLKAVVLGAAVGQARAGGPDAVNLRELAHTVGVSPSAIYRHIRDRDHLMALVAQAARQELAATMLAGVEAVGVSGDGRLDAIARFAATGRGYIAFATGSTQLFRAAFYDPGCPPDAPDDPDPAQVLTAALDELVEVGVVAAAERSEASVMAWSAVHGISTLLAERALVGPLIVDPEAAIEAVLRGVFKAVAAPT